MDITKLTLIEIRNKIASGCFSASEVVKATLENIEKNKDLNALITIDYDGAIESARKADSRLSCGEAPLLNGVPVVVKDNISTKGLPTTCASKILDGYEPFYDATVVKRLKSAGAIIIGKSNMDEFAMGSTSEKSAYGAVKNPFNKNLVAGGSSGGSACAVAAGLVSGALGSDTGGSVRQPSAFCGVVGLKPTYSAVSRYGLIAYASSLDQIGPITKTVKDNALILSVIAGKDEMDATSAQIETDYTSYDRSVKSKTIGIVKQFWEQIKDEKISLAVENAARLLEKKGAKIKEVSLPSFNLSLPSYYAISCAEAASNLARYDGICYGKRIERKDYESEIIATRSTLFGDEVKRRIMFGNYLLGGSGRELFERANCARRLIKGEMDAIFSGCDLILGPTTPTTAFERGKLGALNANSNEDIFTAFVSLAGLPAISVPFGKNANGLPIGIQLVGRAFEEKTLYKASELIEKEMRS